MSLSTPNPTAESRLDTPLEEVADAAVGRSIEALADKQYADGHWCAELEGDSILQSEYLLMKWILGQEAAPLADGRGPEVIS